MSLHYFFLVVQIETDICILQTNPIKLSCIPYAIQTLERGILFMTSLQKNEQNYHDKQKSL